MLSEHIENSIKKLKDCKHSEDKTAQYNVISDAVSRWFKRTNTKRFSRTLILSFFETGFFPTTTQNRHAKQILLTLKQSGVISDAVLNKVGLQQRVYSLKSNDFDSYQILMKRNGYTKTDYFKFVVDKNGIPTRHKIGTSDLNSEDIRDKNGDSVEDFDLSVIRQTIQPNKQGVYSYGNKSIATEKRHYTTKGFIVN